MIKLPASAFLLREGDLSTCGFLIERGRLEVLLERPGGDCVLAVLGPGEIVGEMALVDRTPRAASVRALEDCLLLPITADSFAKRLATADPVLRLFLGTILERFRSTLHGVGGQSVLNPDLKKKNPSANAAARAELRLETELEVGLHEGHVIVHYQPIVRLADGRLAGFESLARWAHPKLGLVPPSTFIPIAEASGLGALLARVVLRRVMQDIPFLRAHAAKSRTHVDDLQLAVNISGHDLLNEGFIDDLGNIMSTSGPCENRVTLELTETALVQSTTEAAKALEQARRLGFKIAVDDFGTGYSSLNYIRTLPVDILKIDQSFVQGMSGCATTRSIIASMLQLAQSLGLKVVGEGIETIAQHTYLQTLGCEYGQGYLFGRPLPFDQTLELISAWRAKSVASAAALAPAA